MVYAGGAAVVPPPARLIPRAMKVNAGEHAWVINDRRFPMSAQQSTCGALPAFDYSTEYLLHQMEIYNVDKMLIIHVCYYGLDNSYTIDSIKRYPNKLAGIGFLVGHKLYAPNDKENPARLEKLMKEGGLCGLRLSPCRDENVVWLNDPVSYPLWKKAEQLSATFNIFLVPKQLGQVADMAQRYPGVNVVIDHLALIDISGPDAAGFDQLLNLARFPNVYIRTTLSNLSKTKQLPYRDVWPFLKRLYDRFGPRRLVWGNFEELPIMSDLVPFFTPDDKEWILGRTAHRLYKFDSRF